MTRLAVAVLGSIALASLLVASDDTAAANQRLATANDVMQEMTKISDRGVPQDLIRKAECMVVVPGLKKGGFIVGAKYGKGFITCRHADGKGWTAPGAIRVEGGSFGFQAGATEVDVILLVMNKQGAKKLLESQFTLGGDATVAAGPIGRSSSAQTDAKLTAGILSYSRSRGVFVGLALDAGTLREDKDENKILYGSKISNRDVLTGNHQVPAGAEPLIKTLDHISYKKVA